jgi:hypothetical protein
VFLASCVGVPCGRVRSVKSWAGMCLFLAVSLWALPGFGHAAPQSFVLLDLQEAGVRAELKLPLTELELAFKHPLAKAPTDVVPRYGAELSSYLVANVAPATPDGQPWQVAVTRLTVGTENDVPCLVASLWMTPPPGAPVERFTLHYDVVTNEVISHVVLVSIRSDWRRGVFANRPEMIGVIRYLRKTIVVDRSSGSEWTGFRGIVGLGMQHIAEGTDHLLFVFMLLLPAPLLVAGSRWGAFAGVRRTASTLVQVVTAFTVGHSLTLVAGAVGWLRLPSRPVEVAIALSIFVSAVHALRPIFPGRERWIAAAFGLVHGLAFAAVISELGLGARRTALAIFGFNLGIELMQLAVVALAVPWLVLLARTRAYPALRTGGALFGGVASLGWIGQRAFGWANPAGPWVEAMARHAWWLLGALAVTALVATVVDRRERRCSILRRTASP